ncbi:DUF6851 domain-containing protein [Nonomuraea muscovyensis]|uniref:DUF6851 domain-containing protein n=1 Tax=Nonomuraea muscovyensis TaxID=1124761 RepID=UPI0033C3F4AE
MSSTGVLRWNQAMLAAVRAGPLGPPHDPADASSVPARTGVTACTAVLEHRHADGSNQPGGYADTTGYAPVNPPMVVASR